MTVKKCPQYELRTHLFALLNNHITYSSVIVPVYEATPKGLARPFVVIGRAEADPSDDKLRLVDEYLIHIDVFTDYGGTLENCAILNSVYQVLSEAVETNSMQLTGGDFCIREFSFGHLTTEVVGNDNVFPELLEQSSLELSFRIRQNI